MSRHSMIEARRSVWDLRCHLLETGDLVTALRQIMVPLTPRDGHIQVKIEGEQVRLPSPMEMNLLRIGQEAAGNAVKHGGARNILVELRYTPTTVRLRVADDGRGFDAAQPSRTGHFGVQDMRERAQSMGCELKIVSEPDRGTSVTVEVQIHPGKILDAEHKADTYPRR
jgi:two-component system sensor histidine kinase DegS